MDFKKLNFKKEKNDQNPFAVKDDRTLWEKITDNKKIVMPVVLVAAVALTIVIALNANKRDSAENVDDSAVAAVNEDGNYVVPDVALEKNAYEDVNALMKAYYDAYKAGDMEAIKSIYTGLESTEELKLQEVSKNIVEIPVVDVYTKPGPLEGSYVAYVYNEVLFDGFETALPGMQTMFVCTDENGSLYINGDVVDDRVTEYISNISLQADVVDLNNQVAANYNEIIEANPDLAQFLSDMSANIQVSVGEALAAIESGDPLTTTDEATAEGEATEGESTEVTEGESAEAAEGESTEATEGESTEAAEGESTDAAESETTDENAETTEEETTEESTEESAATTKQIKATDIVNIRSSDSETADKLGKTEVGSVYTQLESLDNGWSKIEYDGGTAYVKSEYFEEVTGDSETTETETTTETEEDTETEETTETEESTTSSNVSSLATGDMRVSATVRLRKSQSTDAEVLAHIYAGETINVIEQYANGWAKVEYNGDTGYIMTEYLTE